MKNVIPSFPRGGNPRCPYASGTKMDSVGKLIANAGKSRQSIAWFKRNQGDQLAGQSYRPQQRELSLVVLTDNVAAVGLHGVLYGALPTPFSSFAHLLSNYSSTHGITLSCLETRVSYR